MPPYSKTDRLIEALKTRIASGEFPPGSRLPSGSQLCAEYSVSMMVVRMAVERLRAAGVVDTVPGSGVYVAQRASAE